jgi:hypothetical protein
MLFRYRQIVLDELARHGIIPREDTPPELAHDYINELYLYEIRSLKSRMLSGLIPRSEYASHVESLRNRYPLLALPVRYWVDEER